MASGITIIVIATLLTWCLGEAKRTCSSGTISCKSRSQCINLSDVCANNGLQCSDGSDEDSEICKFWLYNPGTCSSGEFYCSGERRNSNRGCMSIASFCSNPSCVTEKDSRICELVKKGKLGLNDSERGLPLNEETVNLLMKAVNSTSLVSEFSCPMLYTRVGDACLSFFSLGQVPWAEARQFCLSIKGDLLDVRRAGNYEEILQYMRQSLLTTDYWTGGRFDMDTNAWSWVHDNKPMPLGAPYWATRYSSSCVPRSPLQTDPASAPPNALPGAPCYHYLQAPAQHTQGFCGAMTYEHYYYFTDENCLDIRSPLCVYVPKAHGETGNAKV